MSEYERGPIDEIAAERRRQIDAEGWTAEHDDLHTSGKMVRAAACYAYRAGASYEYKAASGPGSPPPDWPWDSFWWKPTTPRRDLIKAGALIVAELERLDRAALRAARGQA